MEMKSRITVKRYPYEEPYAIQLEFIVSNGDFHGITDIYCNAEDLRAVGQALQGFPSKIDDEYRYEYGSENPEDRSYNYFSLRAYTIDSVGHSAIQFSISNNQTEPHEGMCRFSIRADVASVNRLRELCQTRGF